MRIKNSEKLGLTPLRKAALSIAEAGLAAIDTEMAIRAGVRLEGNSLMVHGKKFPLDPEGNLIVVGVGKCALEAGRALEAVFGERLSGGVVVDVREGTLSRLTAYAGTHPFPTEANVAATRAVFAALKGLTPKDTVLFVISGGGSTLLCQPSAMKCEEEAETLRCLMQAGAAIREINVVRKHLSEARGGFLAKYAYPARVVSLVFSDVPGNALEFVASGPTVKDTTTVNDARRIVEKYRAAVSCGWDGALIETPKDDEIFANVANILFVSNETALRAMEKRAKEEGFSAHVVSTAFTGEARVMGKDVVHTLHEAPEKFALLYGGETTVKVTRGSGKGGRNMELALSALPELREGELVLALASDGRDNSDVAGAICDTITMTRAKEKNADPRASLAAHDSYPFFQATGDALVTGETGANISDLIVALKSD